VIHRPATSHNGYYVKCAS